MRALYFHTIGYGLLIYMKNYLSLNCVTSPYVFREKREMDHFVYNNLFIEVILSECHHSDKNK